MTTQIIQAETPRGSLHRILPVLHLVLQYWGPGAIRIEDLHLDKFI